MQSVQTMPNKALNSDARKLAPVSASVGRHKGGTVAYNPWYNATYEHIRQIANWALLSADVEKKMVGIFSWMPQAIMPIRAAGGGYRFEQYNAKAIADALRRYDEAFQGIRDAELVDVDIANEANGQVLANICDALFPIMGSVASSKYLHFSAPTLVPMWDRQIRIARNHPDTRDGFLAYVAEFKADLEVPEKLQAALQRYPGNAVRGWDIVGMENR